MSNPTIQHKVSLADFYVTELIFNAPSPGSKFGEGLSFTLEHATSYNNEIDDKRFFIAFNLNITNSSKDFSLKLTALAAFITDQKINDEFMSSHFPNVNCPAIAFPYIRSYVTNVISSSGYQPIYLPSINFSIKQNEAEINLNKSRGSISLNKKKK